jgi:hypothetical protein
VRWWVPATQRSLATCAQTPSGKLPLQLEFRAKFGLDRVRNAVHCTDLPEDGTLECEYFFKILQSYQ